MAALYRFESRHPPKIIYGQYKQNRRRSLLSSEVYLGSMCTAVLIGRDLATSPPPPALGLIYEGAILVSQDRRHLFVTPWDKLFKKCAH
jgi:hypothetical protein